MSSVLLTGGSGKLGTAIIRSGLFQNILSPSSKELNICSVESIGNYFNQYDFDVIIHTAAMARIALGEKNPVEAIEKNIVGTSNLVMAVLNERTKKSIRFVHISTDGVYPGKTGNYTEEGVVLPYSNYGWTKLGAECAVNLLDNFCIIRTRFFEPGNIPFDTSASDSYTSRLPLDVLLKYIHALTQSTYVGTVNVGEERVSDYESNKKYKYSVKPCSREEIAATVPFYVPFDVSMNTDKLKKLLNL